MSNPVTIEELQKQLEYERNQRQIYEAKLDEVLKLLNLQKLSDESFPRPSSSSSSSASTDDSTRIPLSSSSPFDGTVVSASLPSELPTEKNEPKKSRKPKQPKNITTSSSSSASSSSSSSSSSTTPSINNRNTAVSSNTITVTTTPPPELTDTHEQTKEAEPLGCTYCGKLDHWMEVCRVKKRDEKSSSSTVAVGSTKGNTDTVSTNPSSASNNPSKQPRMSVKDMTCTYCSTKGHHEGICRVKIRNEKHIINNNPSTTTAAALITISSSVSINNENNTSINQDKNSPSVSGTNTPSTEGYQSPSRSVPTTPTRSTAYTTNTTEDNTVQSPIVKGDHPGIRTDETKSKATISSASVLSFPPPSSSNTRKIASNTKTISTTTTESKTGFHNYFSPSKPPPSPSTPHRIVKNTDKGGNTNASSSNASPLKSKGSGNKLNFSRPKVIVPDSPLPLETNLPSNFLSTTVYVYGTPVVAVFNPNLMYNVIPYNFWKTIPIPYRPIVTTTDKISSNTSSRARSNNVSVMNESSSANNVYGTVHADVLLVANIHRREHKNTSLVFERQIALPFFILRGLNVPNYIVIGKSAMESAPFKDFLDYLQDTETNITYTCSPGLIKSNEIFTGERKLAHVTAFGIQETVIPVPGDTDDGIFPPSPFSVVSDATLMNLGSIEEFQNQTEYQLSHCSENTERTFHNLVYKYARVFGWSTVEDHSKFETYLLPTAHLHVRPGTRPNREGENTRYTPKLSNQIEQWFDRLVRIGYAEYCDGPEIDPSLWVNSTVTFTKEDGSLEIVLDLVYLNEFTYGLSWNYEDIQETENTIEVSNVHTPSKSDAKNVSGVVPPSISVERSLITTSTDQLSYNSLASRKVFSSLSLQYSEWRYSLDVSSRNYAGFRTPNGKYGRFIKVPIGVHLLSSVGNEPLEYILRKSLVPYRVTNTTVLLNNDYVCIGTGNSADTISEESVHHMDTLACVFETLQNYGLRIAVPSDTSSTRFSSFLQGSGTFMGTIFGSKDKINITQNSTSSSSSSSFSNPLPVSLPANDTTTVSSDPLSVSVFPDRSERLPSWLNIFPPYSGPDKEWVIRLTQLLQYFRPYYQHIPECMNALQLLLTLANETIVAGRWRIAHRNAWILLRDTIYNSAAVVAVPKWDKHFYVRVDASVGSWAVYILQYNNASSSSSSDNTNGNDNCNAGVPNFIGYFAYRFNTVQQNWENNVREAYAIVAAVRIIKKWIRNYGTRYTVEGEGGKRKIVRCPNWTFQIDHRNLSAMAVSEDPILRRWYHELRTYYFDTQHWPGKINIISDFGSRDTSAPLTRTSELVSLKNRIVHL